MEYGYEKKGRHGDLIYPACPVQQNSSGKFIAAFIVGNGYIPISPIPYASEEECERVCDVHNSFHGWKKEEVEDILNKSMFGRYPEAPVEQKDIDYSL